MAELCRRFGISRKTGYKWLGRFLDGCELDDRSRRPRHSPAAVAAWLEDAIVRARKQRPQWGPKKLRAVLQRDNPDVELPAVSTFALIFKRNGLVHPRRRRRSTPPFSAPLAHASGPNVVWCIDFKGDFLVGRVRCYPLTIMDAYSRYLLGCVALRGTQGGPVRRACEQIFATFGLPEAIRTDNGSPFASRGVAALSQLSAWWLRLGVRHERIEPGKPEQNGRHERMHLTLKQHTASPPAGSLHAQQRVFDRFRAEYNQERPHEALGQRVPNDFFEPSPRRLPDPPWGRDFDYPDDFETVRISKLGYLSWNRRSVFLGTALAHQRVGLQWLDGGRWTLFFGSLSLGTLSGVGRRGRLRFVRNEQVSPVSLE
jgi:transposase InsO family protein